MNKKSLGRQLVAGALILFFVGSVQATPMTWYLKDVIFNDSVTATGSYVYDADTGFFSSINVSTSLGNNYTVVNPSSPGNAGFTAFLTTDVGDLTGVSELTMELVTDMTNAGGTIDIEPSFLFGIGGTGFSFEGPCADPNCTALFPARGISSGFVTTQVPLPATVYLLGFGLIFLRWAGRR